MQRTDAEYEVISREWAGVPPTAMCHASTVLPLSDGTVLAAWFGGSREGADDVAVWYAARRNGLWSAPCALGKLPEAHWNPVLRLDAGGRVRLYYKVGASIANWRTFECAAADPGSARPAWGPPRELVPGDVSGGRGPARNKVVRLVNGRLLAPASLERGVWTAFVDISDDDGATWRASEPVAIPGLAYAGERTAADSGIAVSEQSFYGRGVIQPSLWEDGQGAHMLLRSTEGAIYRSDSADAGETWSPARPTGLPNNNSGLDLDRLPDGRLILACNPVAANWGARSPLCLFVSADNGENWNELLQLEGGRGEFSYPAVVADRYDAHITYTWNRTRIAYWHIRFFKNVD